MAVGEGCSGAGEEIGAESIGVTDAEVLVGCTVGGIGLAVFCDVAVGNVLVGSVSVVVGLDNSSVFVDTAGLEN